MHVLLICTAPGPVSFISVESVNSSSLNISWGAASPANGEITHYQVWVNSSTQHYQSNITAPDMGVIEGRLGQLGPYQEVCPSTCVKFRRMSYRMLTRPCVYTVASLVVPSEVVWPLHSLVAACRDFGHATESPGGVGQGLNVIVYVPFRNYAGWGVAWYSTCKASTQYSESVVGKVWHVRQPRTIAR